MITRPSAGADAWAFAMFAAESENRHLVCARSAGRARRKCQLSQLTDGGTNFTCFYEGVFEFAGRTCWILLLPRHGQCSRRANLTNCVYILIFAGRAERQPRKSGFETGLIREQV